MKKEPRASAMWKCRTLWKQQGARRSHRDTPPASRHFQMFSWKRRPARPHQNKEKWLWSRKPELRVQTVKLASPFLSLSIYICGIYQLSLLPLKINIPQQSVVGRSPRSPPPSLSTTSLLSYDHCYVCAVEHKVALLVPSAVPSHHSDLSAGGKALLLACLRKTDSPLYATTSKD